MQIKNLKDLWIQDGRLTSLARELFFLAGRNIEDGPLSDSASATSNWRLLPESTRWDLKAAAPSHISEVVEVATELGMHKPWLREESSPKAEMVVVLPDEYREFFHRMWFGLREMRGVNHMLMLSSLRPATSFEVDVLGSHKLMPPLSLQATEATMAQFALSRAIFEETTQMRANLVVPNVDGEPAGIDAMISKLLETFELDGEITFVIHQPKIHTAIQVEQALVRFGFAGKANFIAAGPLAGTQSSNHVVDNNYACALLDEACRVIHELAMLEKVCV